MSVYQIDQDNKSNIFLEERHPEVQAISYQKVIENSKLVEGVYRKWNVQSGNEYELFSRGTLDSNFSNLRRMSGLLNQNEHVSSLITGCTITISGKMMHFDVGPGKYKPALFIHWLANGADTFDMDENKRRLTWLFFGNHVCKDATENENTEYHLLKMLLAPDGATITVERPSTDYDLDSLSEQSRVGEKYAGIVY